MKKYLIKGALALVVGGFMASCANDDVEYVPIAQQRTKAYKEAFKELIGGDVDPNQNWGFEKVSIKLGESTAAARAKTRGTVDVNSNEWEAKGYVVPSAITDRERSVVSQWFKDNQNPQSQPVSYSNFFVQNVYHGDHTYTTTADNNGFTHEIENASGQMDYISCSNSSGVWDHINNFNAQSGQIQHLLNSGTYAFSFHDSYGDFTSTKFVIRFIQVDGVWGCYVGFDYETVKSSDGSSYAGDGYYDDRIIKICPGDGIVTPPSGGGGGGTGGGGGGGSTTITTTTTTVTQTQTITGKTLLLQGRVFCEDLGTTAVTTSDIDFNDIVFDARIWENYQYTRTIVTVNGTTSSDTSTDPVVTGYDAEICILAAGGTSESKVGGTNVKNLFGVADDYMINTVDDNTEDLTAWEEDYRETFKDLYAPKTFTADITSLIEALPVDANGNREVGLDIIPIEVTWKAVNNFEDERYGTMQTVGEIKATAGEAPQKICLPLGTVWPSERKSIIGAYPYFGVWARAANAATNFTAEGQEDDYLYMHPANGLAELEDLYSTEEVTDTDTDTQTTYSTTTIPDNSGGGSGDGSGSGSGSTTNTQITLWSTSVDMGDGKAQGLGTYANWANLSRGGKVAIYGTVADGADAIIAVRDAWGSRNFIGSAGYMTDYDKFVSFNGYAEFTLEYGNDNIYFGENGDELYVCGKNFTLTRVIYTPPTN